MTKRFFIIVLLLWLLLEAAILFYLRSNQARWVEDWGSQSNQAAWEQFRQDAAKHQKQPDGTPPNSYVQRRVPSSAEPPVLVLLRDHFTMIQVGAVLFSSVMYGLIVILARGLMTPPDILATKNTPNAS